MNEGKLKRQLQKLKGEDGQYVISTFGSVYGLPALIDFIREYAKGYALEARLDERSRVSYEHESFTKELFKDRVTDVKQWWLETAANAHEDRTTELKENDC